MAALTAGVNSPSGIENCPGFLPVRRRSGADESRELNATDLALETKFPRAAESAPANCHAIHACAKRLISLSSGVRFPIIRRFAALQESIAVKCRIPGLLRVPL
jgi:hypothetical protein